MKQRNKQAILANNDRGSSRLLGSSVRSLGVRSPLHTPPFLANQISQFCASYILSLQTQKSQYVLTQLSEEL